MSETINLLDILVKLVKHRRFIYKIVLISTLLALGLSLIWPKSYKSTVRFFPPPRDRSGISGLLGNFLQAGVSASELNPETIPTILHSSVLMEKVIKKFNLYEVYDLDIHEFVLERLESNIEIEEIREGGFGFNPLVAIEFSFIDKDPQRAEQVTAYYIEQADSIIKQLNQERARLTFETIEKRFLQNRRDLIKAEQELKAFQETYGIFEVETQTKAMIEQLAELKTQIMQVEIQLDVLNKTVSSSNFRIQQLNTQKLALEKKYNELLQSSEENINYKVFQPMDKMPELILQYMRLYREVSVQNEIYKFLYPNYEQARLQTVTQAKGLQILDPAQLPTYKYKPKRLYIVLAGFMFSIFLSFFVVFIKEYVETQRNANSSSYQKIIFVKQSLTKDLKFWKRN